MQETLKKAARWYIREYNFSLEEMRQDLKIVLHRRNIAMVPLRRHHQFNRLNTGATKEELMLIFANKDIINQALTEHGGEPMKEDWYWSSSENSYYYAWYQYFINGNIYNSNKNFINIYVRPVLALSI